MTTSTDMLRTRILMIVTEYDRKQSKKKGYNIWALSHYCNGVSNVMGAVDSGEDIEEALKAGFCGSLLRHIAKKLGIDKEYSLRV